MQQQRLQVYQGKQNRHRQVVFSTWASEQLASLRKEIDYVFLKRQSLSNSVSTDGWRNFINSRLKQAALRSALCALRSAV